MQDNISDVKDSFLEQVNELLNYTFTFSKDISITVKGLLFIVLALVATSIILKFVRKLITRKLPGKDKLKFITFFNYIKWTIFTVIFLIAINTAGVNVTAVLAASAALLIGVGLALQTFFQDIISGVFILIDQSVHAGDIIELEGKVGRIIDIRLRTTRAVTIDNKVLIIPNHLYLTNILFNWTENGKETRESVDVGVAYGSDVQKVKELLLSAANNHKNILKKPDPLVLFTDFGDSSLNFKLIFTLGNGFERPLIQSELRFEIDRLFRENNITIPFPQRDVHLFQEK